MSRNIFRVFGVLLLIALIVAGGAFVYRAGVAQGISQAPEVAEAIQKSVENGQGTPMMYNDGFGYGHPMMYNSGFGYGYPHHQRGFGFGHHFGFGLFHFLGFFIFLFFFLGLLRLIFFRGWAHKYGHWGKWEGNAPSKFDEWHKRAHGETTSEDSKKSE